MAALGDGRPQVRRRRRVDELGEDGRRGVARVDAQVQGAVEEDAIRPAARVVHVLDAVQDAVDDDVRAVGAVAVRRGVEGLDAAGVEVDDSTVVNLRRGALVPRRGAGLRDLDER